MFGLTTLGLIHTIISLFALAAGFAVLIRDGQISYDTSLGKFYVISTILVCLTGFGIFQHGGFGKPHALGILTLIVIAIAFGTGKSSGKFAPYIQTFCYSLTFFFHWVPAITETATRIPLSAPLASSPDDPRIKMAIGICLVLFVIGSVVQGVMLRKKLQRV